MTKQCSWNHDKGKGKIASNKEHATSYTVLKETGEFVGNGQIKIKVAAHTSLQNSQSDHVLTL